MKKLTKLMASITIASTVLAGCGSSGNVVDGNGNIIAPTDGEFVGLSLYQPLHNHPNPQPPLTEIDIQVLPDQASTRDWSFDIDSGSKTFSATESTTGANISGELLDPAYDNSGGTESSAYMLFLITASDNVEYPINTVFYGIGIGDKIAFISLNRTDSNEFITVIKKDNCPTQDLQMVWKQLTHPVTVGAWKGNDIVADLNYNHVNQTLSSTTSWNSQGTVPPYYQQATFIDYPATLTCNNGKFQGVQTVQLGQIRNTKGYINPDGYVVSTSLGWDNIGLATPTPPVTDVNSVNGNYVGTLVINKGNAYGFKPQSTALTAHLDFSANGSTSSILALPSSLLSGTQNRDNLLGSYMNITMTDNGNDPIAGEVRGEFSIFLGSNVNSPVPSLSVPFSNTLVDTAVDQSLSDFKGHITCSTQFNVGGTNKNLVVCNGYANVNTFSTLASTQDNLFTLTFVTGVELLDTPEGWEYWAELLFGGGGGQS